MPYIGNVTTDFNVSTANINNGAVTGEKLSQPFNYDSGTLYLDDTNNRVGILTASPTSTLTVGTGGVLSIPLASAAAPSLIFGTDTNTGLYSPGTDQVAISTNGAGRLFVGASGIITNNASNTNASLNVVGTIAVGDSNGSIYTPSHPINITTNAYNDTKLIRWMQRESSNARAYIGSIGNANFTADLVFGTNASTSDVAATEKVRIDSSGRLLVGTSTSRAVTAGTSINWNPRLQVTKTGVDAANIAAYSFSTYAIDLGGGLGIGPDIILARSNSDTEGIQAAIANNMLLGRITFNGSDGSAFQAGAFIAAASDGQTWTSGDCPTRLVFSTTADGASSPTERLRIDSAGQIESGSLGSAAAPVWSFLSDTNTGIYSPGADQLAISTGGSGRLFVNSAGDVSIGRSSTSRQVLIYNDSFPVIQLANSTTGATSNDGLLIYQSGSDAAISNQEAGFIKLETNNQERLRITSSGLVGIGTSAPETNLDVRFATSPGTDNGGGYNALRSFTTSALAVNTGGALSLGGVYHSNGAVAAFGQIAGRKENATSNDLSGYLQFATNTGGGTMVERVRIDAAGRVGIGTTAPQHLCQIAGTLAVDSYNDTSKTITLRPGFEANANGGMGLAAKDHSGAAPDGLGIYGTDGVSLHTANAGTFFERFRVDSSGRLLVGTSTSQCQLTVWDTSTSVATARFFKNAASTQSYPALVLDKYDNTSTTAQIFLQFTINNQGTASGQINANGASQAAFGTYSDARLKENIVDLPSQWTAIKALRPVEFNYIASEGGGHQIGFVAQEVQEVYPDVVGERSDGMLTLSGMGKNESRLIKVLQEAMERIETLEAKVAALEGA